MARYLVERNYPEVPRIDKEALEGITAVNEAEGIEWLCSFVTSDQRRSYCLFEADSAEAIAEASRRNNLPADVIVEVGEVTPSAFG
jgi:hypothetical protein